ncbi:hypothetical protein [Pediococcus claussenii]|uniref:hypothetical protein n=1 Tax=Pediococcus claussenii TaxID=187452 RepID=UPI00081A8F4C|nr:hypothetical protein [Pediococcus claussenii]ANZ70348.1 hypothetical protein AYR57_08480 [Pediococcus claussenii]ANZ72164.1 hypothetical protein AYR58_08480 [Pediococcus claussenii]
MKLSIFEMQALEYALHSRFPNILPVYMDDFGKVFRGHFITKNKRENEGIWEFNKLNRKLRFKEFRPRVVMPNLFNGFAIEIDDFQAADNISIRLFDWFKTMYDPILTTYKIPKGLKIDGFDSSEFQEVNYFFDYECENTKLSFIELPNDEYELISFEEISTDNA